ncbi:ATP-dependent DNA helicase [Pseudonocardia halophobica]|uniref:ATP-dependent helicase DinG n=1 Tax=Pseudonocardia halophobica TaxID=29401 RepID=A0A9W6NYZ6_9PSEU|nr:ATP-dependent DNA helicase [Pseudonocardia halophobica]GLL14278.1 ATP-dependent DNA helicase DinG [Pseudonocardia halophobica]
MPLASASPPVRSQDLPGVAELLEVAVTAVGGTRREGQDAMAQAVRKALSSGEHLAVQAGTGTGKSLAYLVPAIRHAMARDTTVVISTATIALQRQLVDRDLPRLAKALKPALGREPTFAILKGRRNYLCLNKLHGDEQMADPGEEQLFDAFAISAMGRNVKRLHDWASDTETGDRDELVPGVPDNAWRQVSVTARECLGVSRCPVGEDCFAEKARAEAGRADVVVTNHALLAIDAMGEAQVLPEHDVVVVDEAHELVDRVTGAATGELTAGTVAAAARRCGKLVDQALADRLAEAGEGLGMVLEDLPNGRWEAIPQAATGALTVIRDAAGMCRQALGGERREDPEGATGRKLALALLDEVSESVVRVLKAFEEPDPAKRYDVVWLAEQGPDGARHKVLRVAPLSVGGLLRERLFGQRTTVLTSATLALGGSFDALARQWGLPPEKIVSARPEGGVESAGGDSADPVRDPDAPRWKGLDVGSPFAHGRSGILYVAKHLPPPGRDGLAPEYLDEIAGLVEAAGGRTLGLFSSMRAAKQATEALRGRLSVPLLCQGDDSTMLLVKRFAEDTETCLFGTLSLWQGVDVPGPSLSCVIIDRIPFPRPDDPLVAARQKAADSRGGNGFLTVSATHAALLLAQGAGRLLRGTDDRGVVAILDPRIATARYGGFLRASLPPFWQTTDAGKVRAALTRLREA